MQVQRKGRESQGDGSLEEDVGGLRNGRKGEGILHLAET
jgi:hypothetical protein